MWHCCQGAQDTLQRSTLGVVASALDYMHTGVSQVNDLGHALGIAASAPQMHAHQGFYHA